MPGSDTSVNASWSDGGNRTSHRHSLVKGSFRLVLTKERGTYTLHMMPARKWASYKPPVKWEDDAEVPFLPKSNTTNGYFCTDPKHQVQEST